MPNKKEQQYLTQDNAVLSQLVPLLTLIEILKKCNHKAV